MQRNLPENFPPDLLERRMDLRPLILFDFAWEREDAIRAIDIFAQADMAILGGDVYEIYNDRAHPLGDNWYCNRNLGEDWSSYVQRSAKHAKGYVVRYPEREKIVEKRYAYSIAFSDEERFKKIQGWF